MAKSRIPNLVCDIVASPRGPLRIGAVHDSPGSLGLGDFAEKLTLRALATVPRTRHHAVQSSPCGSHDELIQQGEQHGYIPATYLTNFGTLDQTEFKRKVYEMHVRMTKKGMGKQFFPGVPEGQLSTVEGNHKLRHDAAEACRALLAQARADLGTAQAANDPHALSVKEIGIASSYRDPPYDFSLWNRYFGGYYEATRVAREKMPGGGHGQQAVAYLAHYISPKKAVAGFSNHTAGVAIDFKTTESGKELTAKHSQDPLWEKAWLYQWLQANAPRYGFQELKGKTKKDSEMWHWDHKG